jgi:predicted N-acetyltransferase YhbS
MTIRFRTMTAADVAGGMALKYALGWNQTEADWHRFLALEPDGSFVADSGGRIVGTVTTIVFDGRIGWIGMMLVDPEYRRQGIGESLMRMALKRLKDRQVATVGLDATPMGQPLYERLGFVATARLHRWSLERDVTEIDSRSESETARADVRPSDLRAICDQDRAVFGADRSRLIQSLAHEVPGRIVMHPPTQARVHACVIVRTGAVADHLGAWMADSAAEADAVLDAALAVAAQPRVFADVPADHPWAGNMLSGRGFGIARDLTRMYLGTGEVPSGPIRHCAILGPEFG